MNYIISHIHREGDYCADFFARLAATLPTLKIFEKKDILRNIKGMLRLDKCDFPYLMGRK